ncbi:MAG: nuclear transport factor 2 family protein [Novosphingobium sp.]
MDAVATLLAKDEIRELVLLYSRGVDRKDVALLRDLYTADATDTHGDSYDGPAGGYCDFLERALPHMRMSAHNVCNHMISVAGDEAEGEVYAIAWHLIPDGQGGLRHDVLLVRYIDRYRREGDGRWRFAKRVVTYDARIALPADDHGPMPDASGDPSHGELTSRLFARGARGGGSRAAAG